MAGSEAARDILSRQTQLEQIRHHYEPAWRDVADYCAPDAPEFLKYGFSGQRGGDNQASRTDRRTRRVYDSTVRQGQRRLGAGLESLITPQNERWHGLSTAAINDEETDEEKEWGEGVRDFLFDRVRYSPESGFVPGIQSCYANIVRFGPAYLYAEDYEAGLVRYCSLPISEVWIARDKWGRVDTLHRRYKRSARVALQMFGSKLPAKYREMALDPAKKEEELEIIQAIYPNKERTTYDRPDTGEQVYLDGPFKSCHVIVDGEEIVKERTFKAFPVACFNWGREDGDDYGTSPVIELLTEVREINAVRKGALRALQGVTDPALALGNKIDWLPPLDPGSRHAGMIDEQGNLMVQPILSGMRPDYAFQYIERSQATIQEGLYVNLFQVLVSKPNQQTATEALIRQEEKGALLGPAGSSIQAGLSMLVDRELALLEGKGLYEEGSRFVPPASLAGKEIRVSFTSPLDILRKTPEARSTIEAVTTAAQMSQVFPEVLDNVDADEAWRVIHAAGRAPQRIAKRKDEVEKIRKAKADAMANQRGMEAAAQAAAIAKDAMPALGMAADSGLLPGLVPQQSQ